MLISFSMFGKDKGDKKLKTKRLVSSMLLILMMFASFTMVVPLSMASPTIHVYVDPPSCVFYMNTTDVGDTFDVDVVLTDVVPADDLVGVEFKLYWDTSVLEGVSIVLPSGHIFQGAEDDSNMWIVKKQLNKTGGYVHYMVTCSDLSQGYTGGYLPIGNGIATTITLKIIDEPPQYGELSCDLELKDVDLRLADSEGGVISRTKTDGFYSYIWTPSQSTHDVAVTQITASPTHIIRGELIYINVTVENKGAFTESFDVTVYADTYKNIIGDEITVGMQTVHDLPAGTSRILNFVWDTADVPYGNYWISAEASVVAGETNTANNLLVGGVLVGGIHASMSLSQIAMRIMESLWHPLVSAIILLAFFLVTALLGPSYSPKVKSRL